MEIAKAASLWNLGQTSLLFLLLVFPKAWKNYLIKQIYNSEQKFKCNISDFNKTKAEEHISAA